MSKASSAANALDPNLLNFEIRHGMHRIRCGVLDDALDAVSGQTAPSNPTLRRRSFDRFRTLINAAASVKLATMPPEFAGPLVLTRDDLRRVPTQPGAPSFGSAPRVQNRPPAPATTADAPETAPTLPAV
jgi:hypothetical protein